VPHNSILVLLTLESNLVIASALKSSPSKGQIMSDEMSYHGGRAYQERTQAARAAGERSRDLHNELADRHLERVKFLKKIAND